MYKFPTDDDQERFEQHKNSRESLSPMNEIALIRVQIDRLLRERPDDPALIKSAESIAKLSIAAQKELTKTGELFSKAEVAHVLHLFAERASAAMKPMCMALIAAYPGDEIITDLHDSLVSAICGILGDQDRAEIAQREVLKLREVTA